MTVVGWLTCRGMHHRGRRRPGRVCDSARWLHPLVMWRPFSRGGLAPGDIGSGGTAPVPGSAESSGDDRGPAGGRRPPSRPGRRARRGGYLRCSPLRGHPTAPSRPGRAGLVGRDAVHLPQPGAVDVSRRPPCPGRRPSWSGPAGTSVSWATLRPTGTAGRKGGWRCTAWIDHYRPLRAALGRVAEHLQSAGWRARVVADDNALVDRAAAVRAGLGWYGKNTNVLLPGAGSWFVLGSVLTDAPLTAGTSSPRPVPDGCGSCQQCLTACPTGALVGAGQLDGRRCLAWLLQAPGVFPPEFRVALGDRMYGCDDCQTVCPINRMATRRHPPDGRGRVLSADG